GGLRVAWLLGARLLVVTGRGLLRRWLLRSWLLRLSGWNRRLVAGRGLLVGLGGGVGGRGGRCARALPEGWNGDGYGRRGKQAALEKKPRKHRRSLTFAKLSLRAGGQL